MLNIWLAWLYNAACTGKIDGEFVKPHLAFPPSVCLCVMVSVCVKTTALHYNTVNTWVCCRQRYWDATDQISKQKSWFKLLLFDPDKKLTDLNRCSEKGTLIVWNAHLDSAFTNTSSGKITRILLSGILVIWLTRFTKLQSMCWIMTSSLWDF